MLVQHCIELEDVTLCVLLEVHLETGLIDNELPTVSICRNHIKFTPFCFLHDGPVGSEHSDASQVDCASGMSDNIKVTRAYSLPEH